MKLELLDLWLEELTYPADVEDFVQVISEGGQGEPGKPAEFYKKVAFFTKDHKYTIVAIERSDDTSYLGCQVSVRKPRAGEDWTRGNDLPDGSLDETTWEQIKNKIIAYELIKLSPKPTLESVSEE